MLLLLLLLEIVNLLIPKYVAATNAPINPAITIDIASEI